MLLENLNNMEETLQKLQDTFQRHDHNGLNSNEVKKVSFITYTTLGGGNVFVATRPCIIKRVSEVHGGTATGATVIEKLTGTTAVGSGTNLLTANFSLAVASATVTNGTLTDTIGIPLSRGERIGSWVSGSSVGLEHQCITFEIEYI